MARTVIGLREMMRLPTDVDHGNLWYAMEHSNYLVQKGRMDAEHWMKRATLLYSFRKYEEALTCLNMVLVERPNHAEAYFLKGVCYQLLGLEASPDPALVNVAGRMLFEKALACMSAAARLNPGDEETQSAMKTLHLVLGRAEPSGEPASAATEADPPTIRRIPPLPGPKRKPEPGTAA